jgi:HlyD family secretion protein
MKPTRKQIYIALSAIAGVALLVYLFRPVPLQVDIGKVETGSMQVTVDELGETRSHDRFVITAPVAGRLAA